MIGYLFDEALRETKNRQGQNYWDVYIEELLRLLGATGKAVSPADLDRGDTLAELEVLIAGRQTSAQLDDETRAALAGWVHAGGILIGFGVEGMDEVFGVVREGRIEQPPDEYTITATFDLRPHPITHEIHPGLFIEQRLLIVSDVEQIISDGATELAGLYDTQNVDLNRPAVTWNAFGAGFAGYFAFDVAQTIWLLHQGRPIPADVEQTRISPAAKDLCILGANSRKVPYADVLSFVVQNMIAQKPLPFVHQIPPKDGKVADALLSWGGDEYRGPTEFSLDASDFLAERGIQYHINLEAENHPMTQAEAQHILDNDHEISEYYHRTEEFGEIGVEEQYHRQSDEFFERFGYRPITSVNGTLLWNGWVDTARWMEAVGSKSDNSFAALNIRLCEKHFHPMANGPFFGFGFGTTFPFYFYDDAEHGNRRIDITEQPIVCYEMGHRGSLLDHETDVTDEVHLPVEMAIRYHMVMNMFYHPTYVARYPRCRKAIDEILATIERKGARVIHMGNDAVHHWWETRANATLENVKIEGDSVKFECNCEYEEGMVVKMLTRRNVRKVNLDVRWPVEYEIHNEFAGHWLYVVVGQGKHTVEVCFE